MRDDFPFDRRLAADILGDPDTCATVLHLILLAAYGDELYGDPAADIPPMESVEYWIRVKEDFHVTVPESNENKINALVLALSTDAFYDDPLAFISICSALHSGDLGDLVDGVMEDLTIPEMLWGIYEVELNRGSSTDFVPAIDKVIEETINEEAEDTEDKDPEDVISYYERFVQEMRDDMLIQMKTLGVSDKIIADILHADLTPTTNLNEPSQI